MIVMYNTELKVFAIADCQYPCDMAGSAVLEYTLQVAIQTLCF